MPALGLVAVQHDFGIGLRRQFGSMDVAAAAKTPGVAPSVGHVVAVRKEDVGDPAQGLEAANQLRQEFG